MNNRDFPRDYWSAVTISSGRSMSSMRELPLCHKNLETWGGGGGSIITHNTCPIDNC